MNQSVAEPDPTNEDPDPTCRLPPDRDPADFEAPRVGTGTREWGEHNVNICLGCSHGCIYCYAAHNAARFKQRAKSAWGEEVLTKQAAMTSYPRRKGVVIFPTTHDITPVTVDAFIRVAKLILAAGNRLLIVSKPQLACIARVCEDLLPFQDQMLFRFTIGTLSTEEAAFWEPGAPTPVERIEALRLACTAGYRTSISAEPLLGGLETARSILDVVRPFAPESVWIGKLNRPRQRIDISIPENLAAIERIERLQCDDEIRRIVNAFGTDPLVRWKDSVQEVIAHAT